MELECLYVQTPRPEPWGLGNGPVRGMTEHQSTCEMKGVVLFVLQGVNFVFVFCHPIPCSSDGNLPAMQETRVRSLVGEDPLVNGMATHSSILAWRVPWTEEPCGLQCMGSQRVGHD